jgi:acetolactate synthase regulatory subunit
MSYHRCSYRLHVAAEADSTFLSRVCGVLASLSLVPESFHSRRDADIADRATLAIILIDATPRQVDLLERKLLQITQVVEVKCEDGAADADQ